MDPLGQKHLLIMYDQRGGGRSDLVTAPRMLTVDAEVRDLEALRQHFGAAKMSLVGLSWGAGLAAYYATAHPDRVSRIVFLSPMPVANRPFVEERDKREKSLMSKEDITRLNELDMQMKTAPDDKVPSLCSERAEIFSRVYLAHPERMKGSSWTMCAASPAALRNSALVFKEVVGSLGDFDLRPILRQINVPVLVIEGEKTNIPLDSTREWATAPPEARMLFIPDAGHACFVDQTHAVVRAIQSFMGGAWPLRATKVKGTQ
jgi:proline iminopeptidase